MKIVVYSLFLGLLLGSSAAGWAQYHPGPAPVSQGRQKELLVQLARSKPDTIKVRLLLDLCNLYFYKPLKIRANFDTAQRYARQAAQLSEMLHDARGQTRAQLYTANILVESGDLHSAEAMLDKVQDTAKVDLLLLLSFHYWWEDFSDVAEAFSKSLKYAGQARDLSIKLQLKEKELLALQDIAAVHIYQDKFSLAESELQTVVKRMQAIRYPYLHYSYFFLSLLYRQNSTSDKDLYYALESIKSMNASFDTLQAGDFYYSLATVYKIAGEYQQCIEYAKRAIASYKIHWGEFSLFDAVKLINSTLTRLHKNDEAYVFLQGIFKHYQPQNYNDSFAVANTWDGYYTAIKRTDSALSQQLQLFELAKRKNMVTAVSYQGVGSAYIQDHQYAKAKPYLLKALYSPNAHPNLTVQSILHYWLFLCDSSAGDYISAIRHLSINKELDDSLASISKAKVVKKIQIELETQKKEEEIKSKDQNIVLLTQRNEIQQADLRRDKMIRNFTFLGVLILLSGGGLLYWQYRQKHKANQLITEQNGLITRQNDLIVGKNEMLESLVAEKEWLVKEAHHRVKNNLHTIICLLEYQASYLENDALKAIEISQHRIYAMSLIHQKIYQSEDIRTIDMEGYLREFIEYLRESFGRPAHIQFTLEIEDLRLGVSQAIPMALIVNEAVTNSIKYAFPDERSGKIDIELSRQGRQVRLGIMDDGIGMDPLLISAELNSLGLQLIRGLSRELGGEISFETTRGTRIILSFEDLTEQHLYI